MEYVIKTFDELTTLELYEILKLRAEIFIVEQQSIYQDLDDLDKSAYHMYIIRDNEIVAYLRIINNDTASIGRVLVKVKRLGLGSKLVNRALKFAKESLKMSNILISAQLQAKVFYEKLGFNVCSYVFELDGIPHVEMIIHLN